VQAYEISDHPIFTELTGEQLQVLAPLFGRQTYVVGETIFSEGEPARTVYILEAGEVTIQHSPEDGGGLDVATIRPGDAFGWSAILGRPTYTSAAVCRRTATALAASGSELRRVMREHPDVGVILFERMAQVVASRLEGLRSQLLALFPDEGTSLELPLRPQWRF